MVECDMSYALSVEACIQSILHKPPPVSLYTAVFCCGCRGIDRLTTIEYPVESGVLPPAYEYADFGAASRTLTKAVAGTRDR